MLKKFVCCTLVLAIMASGLGFADSQMRDAQEIIESIIRNAKKGNHEPETEPLYEPETEPLYKKYDIKIEENKGPFNNESALVYSIYMTIADTCHHFDYVNQNNNPEVTYDSSTHELFALLYLTLYAQCNKEEAREIVEEYTDVLIEVLVATYPNIDIDGLCICWEIPAVVKDSLYAARFWCEKEDGVIKRGEGGGEIY